MPTSAGTPNAAAVYKTRCAGCHGESGQADSTQARALKVRPFTNDQRIADMAPAGIAHAIKSDPKHQGMGVLNDLDDAQVKAVAGFVKELAAPR